MSRMRRRIAGPLARLARAEDGSSAIEFALIGPAMLVMLFGVLQVGIGLQNYNALRNVSADVARYAMVQHQTGNVLTTSQIRTYALNHATGAPYLLSSKQINAAVTEPATQRVTGAKELSLTVTYQMDSLLEIIDISGPFITYTRPVFLLDNSGPAPTPSPSPSPSPTS